MIVDGIRWWSTQQAVAQLAVTRNTINQWVSRAKREGHTAPASSCPRCAAAAAGVRSFPHVDPPRVRGRGRGAVAAYNADQLLAAEGHTAGAVYAAAYVSAITSGGASLTPVS